MSGGNSPNQFRPSVLTHNEPSRFGRLRAENLSRRRTVEPLNSVYATDSELSDSKAAFLHIADAAQANPVTGKTYEVMQGGDTVYYAGHPPLRPWGPGDWAMGHSAPGDEPQRRTADRHEEIMGGQHRPVRAPHEFDTNHFGDKPAVRGWRKH